MKDMNERRDVRNIWCAVLNYQETAQEVNAAAPMAAPIFFLKAGSTVTFEEQPIILPSFSQEVLYEIEVALQFNEKLEAAWAGLALDLTAGDLQRQLEAQAFPWTLAKSFKNSCPVGTFFPIESHATLENLEFRLEVNGSLRQKGNTSDMVFSCHQLVKYLLDHYPVRPYDLLLTGTPGGVSKINKGDELIGKIDDTYSARWTVQG
jgi:acylpyruvate hydrolase